MTEKRATGSFAKALERTAFDLLANKTRCKVIPSDEYSIRKHYEKPDYETLALVEEAWNYALRVGLHPDLVNV